MCACVRCPHMYVHMCCGCTCVCVHKHVHMQPCMHARLYCAVRVCTVCAKGADMHAHSTVVPAANVKPPGRFPRSPQCRVQAGTRPGAGDTAWRSRLRVGAASAAAEPKRGQGDRGRRPSRTPPRDPPSRTHPHAGAPRPPPGGRTQPPRCRQASRRASQTPRDGERESGRSLSGVRRAVHSAST